MYSTAWHGTSMPEGSVLLSPTCSQGLSEVLWFLMEEPHWAELGVVREGQEQNFSVAAFIVWGHSKLSHQAHVQEHLSPRCEGPEAVGCSPFSVCMREASKTLLSWSV